MESNIKAKPYFIQFDGARGLLLQTIIILHLHFVFVKAPSTLANFTLHSFFVASGFLITSILLKDKERSENFKVFFIKYYIKRLLRIFPVYFGYIFLMVFVAVLYKTLMHKDFLFTITEIKQYFIYLFSFTYNFKDILIILFGKANVSSNFFPHLWSISLEEQFYIVIPFLIYFLSKKQLKILSIIIIVVFVFIRFFGFQYLHSKTDDYYLLGFAMIRNTFFQYDVFFYGVLLALLPPLNIKKIRYLFWISIVALILNDVLNLYYIQIQHHIPWYEMIARYDIYVRGFSVYTIDILLNISCFFFLHQVFRTENEFPLLRNKTLVNWGKLSYGGYVYQYLFILPTIYFLYPLLKEFLPVIICELLCTVLCIFLLMQFSKLSYYKFELPIMQMKDKVYSKFFK